VTEQHAVNADTDHSAHHIDPMQSPGAWLKAERLRQGKSIQQVADGLRLRPHQIESLESDDHSRLPGQTFIRGFIRNYARELNVDSAILLGAPVAHTQVQSPSVSAPSGDMRGGLGGTSKVIEPQSQNIPFDASGDPARGSSKALVIAGVVILAAAAAGYWWFKLRPASVDAPSTSTAASTSASTAAPISMPSTSVAASDAPAVSNTVAQPSTVATNSATPAPAGALALPSSEQTSAQLAASTAAALAAQKLASTAPGAAAAPVASAVPASAALAVPSTSPAPAPNTATPAVAAPAVATQAAVAPAAPAVAPAAPAQTASAGRLAFAFTDDAWVQIRGPRGKVIHEKLHTKGSRFEFNGDGKLNLTIGNAKGVTLSQRGAAVDLAKFTNVTTARLSLEP
jgi:cytoskeleton protein RodZ